MGIRGKTTAHGSRSDALSCRARRTLADGLASNQRFFPATAVNTTCPMNVQPRVPMDKDAFLAWAQGREGRFELVERHVVMMVGASKTHALITSQLMRALWARGST